jgi:hypothetical protein
MGSNSGRQSTIRIGCYLWSCVYDAKVKCIVDHMQ